MRRGGTCVASGGREHTRIRKGQSVIEGEQGAAERNPSLQEDAELATLKKRGKNSPWENQTFHSLVNCLVPMQPPKLIATLLQPVIQLYLV